MKKRSLMLFATPFIIVFLIACVCSSSGTTPTIVSTAAPDQPTAAIADQPTAAAVPTEPPAQTTTYNVGDVVQVKDHTIVMNSAEVSNGILKANFTVENTGATNLSVSSLLSFTVKDNDGTKLEQEIFDCGTGLDGDVLVADKLRGDICWKTTTSSPFKIYYQPELFDSASTVVWVVTQ